MSRAARAQAPGLAQRLQLYKLRANVEIRDASPDYTVAAGWGDPTIEGNAVVRRVYDFLADAIPAELARLEASTSVAPPSTA